MFDNTSSDVDSSDFYVGDDAMGEQKKTPTALLHHDS